MTHLLLDNSSHELRNAPINSRQLFDNKIKEEAKSYYEVQQHRFFSSPEHEVLMVSYCGQSMSVVRRASSVVRRQQLL